MSEPEHISTVVARVIENVANLQEAAEGWRRRNLIHDSQLERMERLIIRLDAMVKTYEDVLKRMPDAPWLETKLTHLLAAILKEDNQLVKAVENDGGGEVREMFT